MFPCDPQKLVDVIRWLVAREQGEFISSRYQHREYMTWHRVSQEELDAVCETVNKIIAPVKIINYMGEIYAPHTQWAIKLGV